MSKKILRIRIKQFEVEDDYVARDDKFNDEAMSWTLECDEELYMTMIANGQFWHLTVNTEFQTISATRRFLLWATVSIEDILNGNIPDTVRIALQAIRTYVQPYLRFVVDLLRRKFARSKEYHTRQINFEKWDEQVFDKTHKWFSIN